MIMIMMMIMLMMIMMNVDETKVSFLPLFSSPPLKCLKRDNSREPLRDPAPCFRSWICRKKYLRTTTQDLSLAMHFMVTPPPNLKVFLSATKCGVLQIKGLFILVRWGQRQLTIWKQSNFEGSGVYYLMKKVWIFVPSTVVTQCLYRIALHLL